LAIKPDIKKTSTELIMLKKLNATYTIEQWSTFWLENATTPTNSIYYSYATLLNLFPDFAIGLIGSAGL
jgi:hypothetical protein